MRRPPAPGIDRSSPIPFYFQLAELLEQQITQGRWTTGERLPSEPELCEHYSLSRTTVRQALARLEQEGLIRRAKGRGSFVSESHRKTWLLQSVEGFFADETGRSGHNVSSAILRLATTTLPPWASGALGLPPGSEGVTLERLRSVEGRVALYVVNHLPIDYAETVLSMTDPNESLYGRLRRQTGVEVAGASRTVEAVAVGERMGALLELPSSAPVVAVHSVSYDRSQRAFDCYEAWLRTDRLTIDMEVGTTPARVVPPLPALAAPVGLDEVPGACRRQRGRARPVVEDESRHRPPRWCLAASEHPTSGRGRPEQ